MAVKTLPSQEILCKLLRYDTQTGKLFWKERGIEFFKDDNHLSASARMKVHNGRFSGTEAFTSITDGYRVGIIFGVLYKAHRIIYKIIYNKDPEDIDHIDGNRQNNTLCNLRNVSRLENSKNRKIKIGNKSGETGVCWAKREKKWAATITANYKQKHLGYFDNIDDAIRARNRANIYYRFHKNHGLR